MLSGIELDIFEAARKGHNIIITGQAGTGKTHTLRKLKTELERTRPVLLTATTGIASSVLHSGATTVHSCFGLKDGRYTNEQLINMILNDDNCNELKKRLETVQTVFIDEVSLLSLKILQQIDSVLKSVKRSDCPFGGVQMILCGDFYQLKPVPSPRYGDAGEYIIPLLARFHNFQLREVRRQNEDLLIKAIHLVSRGEITKDTRDFLSRLKRTLPPGNPPLKMFAENYDVDLYNSQCLAATEGQMTIYTSEDSGDVKRLDTNQCSAPKKLSLKKGCPVILIVNVSRELVNGLRGDVHELDDHSVTVNFPSVGIRQLNRYTFSIYDQGIGMDVAFRKQIPLRAAFALTVHKCQGLTLDRVEIDCRHMHHPGQLGVAIGRVTNAKGLRVLNFSNGAIKHHMPEVTAFYEKEFVPLEDDLKCCRFLNEGDEHGGDDKDPPKDGNECNDSSFDEEGGRDSIGEDIDDIEAMEQLLHEWEEVPHTGEIASTSNEIDSDTSIPFHIDIDFEKLIYKDPKTIEQKSINVCFEYLRNHGAPLKTFCAHTYHELNRVFGTFPKSLENKHFTSLYSQLSQYMSGPTYKECVCSLFSPKVAGGTEFRAAFYIVECVRESFLKYKCRPIIETAREEASNLGLYKDSKGNRAKVRYIGGWCVAKLRHHKRMRVKRNLFTESSQNAVTKYSKEVRLLEQLTEDQDTLLQTSTDSESMSEVLRRQNKRNSLINLSDSAYQFFHMLDKTISEQETLNNLHLHGKNFYEHIQRELDTNNSIKECWKHLFTDEDDFQVAESDFGSLLSEVLGKYLKMSSAQFRREYKRTLEVDKEEAHRKQIRMAKKRKGTKSTEKESPSMCTEDMAGTSNMQKQKKGGKGGGGKGGKRKGVCMIEYPCGACKRECTHECVCCDLCDQWFHFSCLGKTGEETDFQDDWFCPQCKE